MKEVLDDLYHFDITQLDAQNIFEISPPMEDNLDKVHLAISQTIATADKQQIAFKAVIDKDYSEIEVNQFLVAIGNLGIPTDMVFNNVSKETKFNFIKQYMELKTSIYYIPSLVLSIIQMMIHHNELDVIDITHIVSVLDKQEELEFIENNKELITKWKTFLDSIILYLLLCFTPRSPEETAERAPLDIDFHEQIINKHEEIDDAKYLSINVVSLFVCPYFYEYYRKKQQKMYYFNHQFNEYIFKGNNLFYYLNNPYNHLSLFLSGIMNGELTAERIKKFYTDSIKIVEQNTGDTANV